MGVWIGGTRIGDGERASVTPGVLSFASKHNASNAFKSLFKEGMALVEMSAGYLDGPGRQESKLLPRNVALAYATESMRLTTRLMQIASWLLLRRAVAEGELTPLQAQSEKHRVRLARQEISCDGEIYKQLPPDFIDLCAKSLRLQERVIHLDQSNQVVRAGFERTPVRTPVEAHWARLHDAFGSPAEAALRR
jgi:regulator of CtrA degradation